MNKPLDNIFHKFDSSSTYHYQEFEIRRLKASGEEFQKLFEDIMVRSQPGFTRVRPYGDIGDRKCDGLFQDESNSTIFQVYSPDELKQSKLQKKIDEDLDGAIQHWGGMLKTWVFVYNVKQGLPPDIPQILKQQEKKYPNIKIESLSNDALWEIARELSFEKRVEIFGLPPSCTTTINQSEQKQQLDRQIWLDKTMKRSQARCISRWQGIGVSRGDAINLVDDQSIGVPPSSLQLAPGKLIILTGEMGVGKSLIGDRLLQNAIIKAKEDIAAPIPMFFEAWQLQGKSLEQAVEETIYSLHPFNESILVIIDEVDAIGNTNVRKLVAEARTIVHFWENTTVILIGKPILELINAEESIKVPLLSQDISEKLVKQISGRQYFSSNSLSKPLQDAIRRPLFAILLATQIREYGVWRLESKEQLLSSLVERALHPFKENINKVSRLLELLAATCIDRGGKTVPLNEIPSWVERQQLLDSMLIVEDMNGLRFPIPILTQWFAAQYLLSNKSSILQSFVTNKNRLELWHYPFVIAVATFSLNHVSELLIPIVEKEPIIAADIVSEALSFQGRSLEMPHLSSIELGQRVRAAIQAWINGFKPLASIIAPALENQKIPSIGVRITQTTLETNQPTDAPIKTAWIEIAWHSGNENLSEVIELPTHINHDNLSSSDWTSLCGFPPYLLPSWVWKWTLEQVISLLLEQRTIPVASGLISLEAAWHAASDLVKRDYFNSNPIEIDLIENHFSQIKEIPCSPMMYHCYRQLEIEIEAANKKGQTHLSLPPSFHIFRSINKLSAKELASYARDVYAGAFEGYLQLLAAISSFVPQLNLVSILPARLVGVLQLPPDSDSISISYYWEPLPEGSTHELDFKVTDKPLSGNDENVMAAMQKWIYLRPHLLMFFELKTTTVPKLSKYWLGVNPATELAYEFLHNDFRKIRWTNSNFSHSGFPYTF